MSQSKHTYFKNLDSLRFFAALFVVIGHCQHQIYESQGIEIYKPFSDKLASFGVDFFFTLSGFLINYILLNELISTGSINVKNFFMRRFLRIWPIYFIFGFAYIFSNASYYLNYAPALQTGKELFYNVLHLTTFTTNIQILIGTANYHTPSHYWSLSVEEQYYFVWVPLLLLFKRRYLWILLAAFIGIGYHYNSTLSIPFSQYLYNSQLPISGYFFTVNHFYHFASGAALAWVLHNVDFKKWATILKSYFNTFLNKLKLERYTPSVWAVLNNKYCQIAVSWGIQLYLLLPWGKYLFGAHYPDDQSTINGYMSVGIIAFAIARYSVFWLENPVLKYGGKVSFGIYIFHIVAIKLSYIMLVNIGFNRFSDVFYIVFPICSVLMATAMAGLSYEYIEKYFLKMKTKFR